MPYLYFQPRTSLKSNPKWILHYQSLNTLIDQLTNIAQLKQIHGQMIRTCLIQDTFLTSRIVTFLIAPSSPHFNIDYAHHIFDQIPHPDLFTWNHMIRGYTHSSAYENGLLLFKQMLLRGYSPDRHTYPAVIKACSQLPALELGKLFHGRVLKIGLDTDKFIMSGFVNLYANLGTVDVARKLFDNMNEKDVVAWTSMISGYARLNYIKEAFVLFDDMRKEGVEPNKVTIVSLLSASGNLRDLDRGDWLHSFVVDKKMEFDIVIGNALISMYTKCGNMSKALEVFHKIPTRNVVSWNSLISGLTQNGLPAEAFRKFREMERSEVRPNEITMVSAVSACAQLSDLEQGKLLHTYIEENRMNYDIVVGNALINMYSKCGDLERAVFVFHKMPETDIFSWTALITGYVQSGKFQEALTLFQEMQLSGVEPNEVTLVSLLSACAQLGALDQGKWIHSYTEEHNVVQDVYLGTALIDMYAKCGSIEDALQVFNSMSCKDTFPWNAMIGGLAANGYGKEAIVLFSQMQSLGVVPDSVTFLSVLCACAHSGMVHEGYRYFNSMYSMYGIYPGIEHYGCMVDLLGRAGHLEDAVELIKKMPVEPNAIIWGSLLSACSIHRKLELGEQIAQYVLQSAPNVESLYVLVSNIYADAGKWDDVRNVRTLMGSKGMEKSPGRSWIEIDGVVKEFHIRDMVHQESELIYFILDSLMLQAKELIYASNCS